MMVGQTPSGTSEARQLNQTAYRLLKEEINRNNAAGRLVAISAGRIVADANTYDELFQILQSQGLHPPDTLVVEAGVNYPEYAVILSQAP